MILDFKGKHLSSPNLKLTRLICSFSFFKFFDNHLQQNLSYSHISNMRLTWQFIDLSKCQMHCHKISQESVYHLQHYLQLNLSDALHHHSPHDAIDLSHGPSRDLIPGIRRRPPPAEPIPTPRRVFFVRSLIFVATTASRVSRGRGWGFFFSRVKLENETESSLRTRRTQNHGKCKIKNNKPTTVFYSFKKLEIVNWNSR
jgi:hypothetical protein